MVYLRDVATIERGYAEVPYHLYRFNGGSALTMGISFASGVNVVDVGARVDRRLAELEYQRPAGMQLATVYNQPKEVDNSVSAFMLNLGEAVAIVIAVLLVFMGVRSGILMGSVLLLTILGTFIIMKVMAIDLQRISLGALIIALGMLVDNAIVVTEGILVGMKRGLSKLEASKEIVRQTVWPLLGATVIAIMAFAPIGLSEDATGEYSNTLFWVLLISLMLSWVTAITLVPFFAGIPKRTGWRGEMRFGLLNDMRKLDKQRYPLMIERFMALAFEPGAELSQPYPKPSLRIVEETRDAALARFGLCLLYTSPSPRDRG